MPRPPKQPKQVYQRGGPRIGGKYNSVLRGFGRGVVAGAGILVDEFTKKPPAKQKSPGTFSSKYLTEKHPHMQMDKARSIIGGMHASKEDKLLAALRLENQLYDPSKRDDPYFSWNEGNLTIKRTRELYGDKVAKEVEKKLQGAFRGKHAISGKEAEKHLSAISQYGSRVREGINLIAKNFDLKVQVGRGAKYITAEKLEVAIQETALKSGKHVARSMRKEFMVEEEGSSSEGIEKVASTKKAKGQTFAQGRGVGLGSVAHTREPSGGRQSPLSRLKSFITK